MALGAPRLPTQCSNYYELLGLVLFEPDAATIEQRLKDLLREARKYQVGPYAGDAEKCLELLAEARGTLLEAEHRSRYDESLRVRYDLPPVTVVSTYPTGAMPEAGIAPGVSVEPPATEKWLQPWMIAVLLLVALGGIWMLLPGTTTGDSTDHGVTAGATSADPVLVAAAGVEPAEHAPTSALGGPTRADSDETSQNRTAPAVAERSPPRAPGVATERTPNDRALVGSRIGRSGPAGGLSEPARKTGMGSSNDSGEPAGEESENDPPEDAPLADDEPADDEPGEEPAMQDSDEPRMPSGTKSLFPEGSEPKPAAGRGSESGLKLTAQEVLRELRNLRLQHVRSKGQGGVPAATVVQLVRYGVASFPDDRRFQGQLKQELRALRRVFPKLKNALSDSALKR